MAIRAAGIAIRPARIEERQALENLQRSASLALEDYREALLAHPEAIALDEGDIRAGHVWVAEDDGVVLGFMVLLPRADDAVELDGLFVAPRHWRRGAGRALVAHAESSARALGALTIDVIAELAAREFYAACGFTLIGSAKTRFGPALRMQLAMPR